MCHMVFSVVVLCHQLTLMVTQTHTAGRAAKKEPPAIVRVKDNVGQDKISVFFKLDGANELAKEMFLTSPCDYWYGLRMDKEVTIYTSDIDASYITFINHTVSSALFVDSHNICYHLKVERILAKGVFSAFVIKCRKEIKSDEAENAASGRLRRASSKAYLRVNVVAVVDSSIYKHFYRLDRARNPAANKTRIFENINIWYDHLIKSASKIYENSLKDDNDLSVDLRLHKVIIAKRQSQAPWTDNSIVGFKFDNAAIPIGSTADDLNDVVDPARSLELFQKFMMKRKLKIMRIGHAIAFTRKLMASRLVYNSKSGESDLAVQEGIAYHKLKRTHGRSDTLGICKGFGFSVISDRMSVRTQFVIAHEIGHNLGMGHDEGEENSGCSSTDNYLMTPTLRLLPSTPRKNRLNVFQLSSCSKNEMKQAILYPNKTASRDVLCLMSSKNLNESATGRSSLNEEGKHNDMLPGQLYSAHTQCRMWAGINASFCVNMTRDVCTLMACRRNQGDDICNYLSASVLDGTPCGIRKWCEQGHCLPHIRAPDRCLWGDAISDCFKIHTLSPEQNGQALCKKDEFKESCCESCRGH